MDYYRICLCLPANFHVCMRQVQILKWKETTVTEKAGIRPKYFIYRLANSPSKITGGHHHMQSIV